MRDIDLNCDIGESQGTWIRHPKQRVDQILDMVPRGHTPIVGKRLPFLPAPLWRHGDTVAITRNVLDAEGIKIAPFAKA